ncbi:hypothetical protein [Leeuwenhoekiella sp. H156]|uniref:hypothetical protein n=1 Tax=Leeuwenhoekiella sp. H156 TaxID=3450128 RepID=UPI003FA4B356
MGLLKKVRSSTLIETLVATVLILIIFVISSMILNSLFRNHVTANTNDIEMRLNTLEYQLNSGQLDLPYMESYKDWEISLKRLDEKPLTVEIVAQREMSKKQINKILPYVE